MLSPRSLKIGENTYCARPTRGVGDYPLAAVSWRAPRGFRAQFARWDGRPCVARVLAFGSRLSILETYFWMKTTAPVSCAAKSQSWKGETDASVRLLATACGLNLNANRQANS